MEFVSFAGAGSISDPELEGLGQQQPPEAKQRNKPSQLQKQASADSHFNNYRWDGTPLDLNGKAANSGKTRPIPRQRSIEDKAPRPPKRESSMTRRREEIN